MTIIYASTTTMRTPRRDTSDFPRIWNPGRPTAVLLLLTILLAWGGAQGALWVVDMFDGGRTELGANLWEEFRLQSALVSGGSYWKLITYALVHSGAQHFFLNVGVLFFAGREVEPIIGRRQFLALTLTAWLMGGVVTWAAGGEMTGFSAVAAAVLAAYSTMMPELEQRLNVFFVIPLRFRAKFYALVVVALASVCLFTGTLAVVGPAGILAGCVVGWAWVKQLGFGNPLWIQRMVFERRQKESRRERMNAGEFVALEVDPILDKISRSGLQSLTRAERRVLEQGREKLGAQSATGKVEQP